MYVFFTGHGDAATTCGYKYHTNTTDYATAGTPAAAIDRPAS